jgi:HTH-type transcriptional regulator, sugar sensing transcriptional regulator
MNSELVYRALESLGFSRLEALIYVYLSKNGPLKGPELCQDLSLTKQQVYPCLKKLRERNAILATIDHPAIFSARPFEDVLDQVIRNKVHEAENTQQNKDQILQAWQSMSNGGPQNK